MRVTVLGASGGVGRWIVAFARESGVRVRAVWRRPPVEVPGGVEVAVEPELLDARALRRTCGDADAILSAVGQRRAHPRNPWSRLISPPDLGLRLARELDAALGSRSPRLVVVSAAGVGDSRPRMSPLLRWLFDHSRIGVGYRDLAEMEEHLRESGRDCSIVRPTTLTRGRRTAWRATDRFRLFSMISRRAVARCMVDRALHGDIDGFHTEMITGRR